MARKSWNDTISPPPLRRRAIAPGFAFSALSISTSTIWQPAACALVSTSNCAASDPLNLPPFSARRQVAMAVTNWWVSRKRWIFASAAAGCFR